MAKLVTFAQLAAYTHWGAHGTYFNSRQYGFPEARIKKGEKLYSLEEVLEWDRDRPMPPPLTENIVILSNN
jgi:bisphosphoglycerate-dependent phosphoglycerate mutase